MHHIGRLHSVDAHIGDQSIMTAAICCPVCWRGVTIEGEVVAPHPDYLGQKCPMSAKPVPDRSLREVQLEHAANGVLLMAAELRDDAAAVWAQIDTADPREIREWLIIALAAIDIDKPARDLLAWVENLPVAGAA
uniref:DUF7368 family protein n=1 Tax=Mycobacterium intracellulare TaxID=1767 RepID=UPI0013DEB81D|nr:hypothetical protein [Mycobacterium intracellulare]